MSQYKERMIEEYKQLKERYNKLHRLLVKYDAGTLDFTPTCPVDLLRKQAKTMGEYLYILEIRAEIEDVDLDLELTAPIDIKPIGPGVIDPSNPVPVPKPIKPIEENM